MSMRINPFGFQSTATATIPRVSRSFKTAPVTPRACPSVAYQQLTHAGARREEVIQTIRPSGTFDYGTGLLTPLGPRTDPNLCHGPGGVQDPDEGDDEDEQWQRWPTLLLLLLRHGRTQSIRHLGPARRRGIGRGIHYGISISGQCCSSESSHGLESNRRVPETPNSREGFVVATSRRASRGVFWITNSYGSAASTMDPVW
mmetsp:Transcript_17035/g.37225  ORF Transcript_17035/g.37225 Transcript_17035/m.37225 type:complete len:201 (-) Transcript_17035:379-981(-)